MPLPLAAIASTGFSLAKKAGLGKRAKQAVSKGFGLLKDRLKGAKFTATERGFNLTAEGFRAQGGAAAASPAAAAAFQAPQVGQYLPYIIGGALLLMFLKK